MRVVYSDTGFKRLEGAVVTVGSYDGVHFGHRQLLETVKRRAQQQGTQSVVVTFAPHPRQVLVPDDPVVLLNSLPEKLFLLQEAGIDNVVVCRFDHDFAHMPYDRFVRDVLVDTVGMGCMVLGYNHHFGSNRHGNFTSIEKLSVECGFVAERIERSDVDGQKVSSTVIRALIAAGQMHKANHFLTRPYILIADVDADGKVVVNEKDKLLPPAGRYHVAVQVGYGTPESRQFDAVLEVAEQTPRLLAPEIQKMKNAVINFI